MKQLSSLIPCVKKCLLSSVIVTVASTTFSEVLDVEWLYLSNYGSWVARTESFTNTETNVRLPVEYLTAEQFWWHAEKGGTQLVWSQPDQQELPTKGAPVEIKGEPGLWLINEVSPTHLVLQQGKDVRYWPQSQWHLLRWTASAADEGFELKILQTNKQKNNLFYAWQEAALTAQVRYRLDIDSDQPSLYQELIVSNLSDYDLQAPGYSFAQTQVRPTVVAMRTMSLESDQAVSAPQSGQSQGVPTLFSEQPFKLNAGAHIWLPVSETKLSKVERVYQLQWDSRQQGLQQAESSVRIQTSGTLPDISGPVKIGVFDGQVALLESHYQPTSKQESILSLGQSSLVSMNSKLVGEGKWRLTVDNRTSEKATLALTISHWNGKTGQKVPMTVKVPANETEVIDLVLSTGGLIKITK